MERPPNLRASPPFSSKAPVAQLDRAPDFESGGQGFESLPARQTLYLAEQIRTYDFDQMAFVIIMILITVAAIDWVCARLRFAAIGPAAQRS